MSLRQHKEGQDWQAFHELTTEQALLAPAGDGEIVVLGKQVSGFPNDGS